MKRFYFWLWLLLSIAWAAVIFSFSAQNAEKSSETSSRVVDIVVEHFVPKYKKMPPQKQYTVRQMVTLYVRKSAHMMEYFLLGILLSNWFSVFIRTQWLWRMAAFGSGSLFAASDEFHQNFSAGRSPQAMDVLIDASGVMCGVIAVSLLHILLSYIRGRRGQHGKLER